MPNTEPVSESVTVSEAAPKTEVSDDSVNAEPDQKKKYKSVISHVEVDLPEAPLRYTACPSVDLSHGVWAATGINAANVGMTATETITTNPRVLAADPMVVYQKAKTRNEKDIPGGIGEEDLVLLVLPYIHSAREGVLRVAELLEKEPKALVHRDFQSTNVLWKDGELRFIDFQGMRLGPAAYDLASLLYDPYVTFTEGERRALAALYAKKCGRPEIEKVLPFAAVQRLVQCLGAYGRLASVCQPQFGKYVLPALQNLLAAADEAGLDAVGALAEDLIAEESNLGHGHDGCSCGHHHHHR